MLWRVNSDKAVEHGKQKPGKVINSMLNKEILDEDFAKNVELPWQSPDWQNRFSGCVTRPCTPEEIRSEKQVAARQLEVDRILSYNSFELPEGQASLSEKFPNGTYCKVAMLDHIKMPRNQAWKRIKGGWWSWEI